MALSTFSLSEIFQSYSKGKKVKNIVIRVFIFHVTLHLSYTQQLVIYTPDFYINLCQETDFKSLQNRSWTSHETMSKYVTKIEQGSAHQLR